MNFGGAPENVCAVLVGIESYQGGDRWALDGPAISAMRMAAWLLRQFVQPGNIRLYVNFHPNPASAGKIESERLRQLMTEKGIAILEPSRANLEAALDPGKLPRPAGPACSLLLYFCGHGLSSEVNHRRYALTMEARAGAYEAIDLVYQSGNLRQNELARRYAKQWIIQDACAQTTASNILPRAFSGELPKPKLPIEQYFLYATRPGEFGLSNPGDGGAFTVQLLEVLDKKSLADLDLESVYAALEARFKGSDQHPTLYRRDENWAEAWLVPGGSWADPDATAALALLLRGALISVQLRHAVFREVSCSDAEPPAGIEDTLRALESLVSDANTTLNPVERFAIRLESYCQHYAGARYANRPGKEIDDYRSAGEQLAEWINRWPAKRDAAAVSQERDRLRLAAQNADRTPVIVLDLEGDGECGARAWRYGDGKKPKGINLTLTKSELPERVAEALDQLAGATWLRAQTVIELVLPLGSLVQRFEGIEVVVDPKYELTYRLGDKNLLLLLRVSDRWFDTAWHENWKSQWGASAAGRKGNAKVAWIDRGATPGDSGWCWVGASDAERQDGAKRLRKALYDGAPFALWCDEAHSEQVETALTVHTYADLIALLREVSALNAKGQRLTCLVDDADRLPPGAMTNFKQRAKKAAQ